MAEPDPRPPMRHASRGSAHSSFAATMRASIESPTAWLAAAVPIGIGAALAAVVALFAQLGRASLVNGRLDMLGAEPVWWAAARIVGGVLLVLGVAAGVAAASRTVRDFVDRRPPSARRAWRETLTSTPLLIAVTLITSLAVGAVAVGALAALALNPGLVLFGLAVVAALVVLGVALLAPLTLALSFDALEGAGLRSFPRAFTVARQYSRLLIGKARVRATVMLLLGLAVAALAAAAPWGGSLPLVALVTFGTTLVVVAWAVLAAGVWTGIAADGLEALGRTPAEGSPVPVPGTPRRLLLSVGALALAPLLTATALAIPSGIPAVESQEARAPLHGPTIAPYGDGGVAVLSMIGLSGHRTELTLCGSASCRTLDVPDMLTIAMSATPEGDLVFARWRRTPGQPELVLTRLTPSELDGLIDGGREDAEPDSDSRMIGQDDGPGATVVLAQYEGELPDSYERDRRGQDTTMVAVDATGSTPVVASLEAFPKQDEPQRSHDETPTLSVYRCQDADCASTSTSVATGFPWSPSLDGSGPTYFDIAADDDRAAVALASYAAHDDPIRLFTFVDGAEPTLSSLADPVASGADLVGDTTAGLAVALRPDGLATVLWRLPTESSLWLSSCLDDRCAEWTDLEVDPGLPELRAGPTAALAVDDSGRPLIAVATPDGTLALIDCLDAECQEVKRTELIDIVRFGAPIGLSLDGDRPILIADGASSATTTPLLPSQVVRCFDARCG